MILFQTMSWPEAVIASFGIIFATTIVTVAIWQAFGTGRAVVSARGETAYRKLAEQATEAQSRTASALERAVDELSDLRARTTELERLLKEVG